MEQIDKKRSCGILIYRIYNGRLQVLLCKLGGVDWEKKYANSWTTFKGEIEEGESDLQCALREFKEETSRNIDFDLDKLIDLGDVDSKAKINHLYAYEYDFNPEGHVVVVSSNTFKDKSNDNKETPEVCPNAYYYDIDKANIPLIKSLEPFLGKLKQVVEDTHKVIIKEDMDDNKIKNLYKKYCKEIKKNVDIITEPETEEGEAIGGAPVGGGDIGGGADIGGGDIGGNAGPSITVVDPLPAPQPVHPPCPGPCPCKPKPVAVMPLPYGAYVRYVVKQDPKKKKKRKKSNKK